MRIDAQIRRTLSAAATLVAAGGLAAFGSHMSQAPSASATPFRGVGPTIELPVPDGAHGVTGNDGWEIRASGARIIGGYGDNFDYGGQNVRPLDGTAHMTVDTEAGTARLEVRVRTTEESGPIRFSAEDDWTGEIRIVQELESEQGRIMEDVFLHGDTGREAPVMPRLYNYFATWGPTRIEVNGREAVPMIGGHTMFSEQARDEDGRIVDDRGQVYSPRLEDKTGFTDPEQTEFHVVAHTDEPDQNNFPPHTAWIHLHFSDVEVVSKPADAEIPYTTD